MSELEKPSINQDKKQESSAHKSSGLVYYKPKDALFPYEIEEFLTDRYKALIKANLLPPKLANEPEIPIYKIGTYQDIIDIPEEEIFKYFPYSFSQYLKEKYYNNIHDIKVIADFSGMYIHNMNVVKVDFSETIFSKCNFQICNFEGCKFRDADLSEVYFFNTNLKGVDFRGSNLSEIRFLGYDQDDKEKRENSKGAPIAKLESIKLSFSEALIRKSLQNNDLIRKNFYNLKENRITEEILNIDERINNRLSYISLSNKQNFIGIFNSKNTAHNQDREYNNLLKIRSNLDKKRHELTKIKNLEDAHSYLGDNIPYNTPPTILSILDSNPIFYPFYLTSFSHSAKDKITPTRVAMSRLDMEDYLKLDDKISLNDYAKNLAIKRNLTITDLDTVIADFSSEDLENKTNLSSMVFNNVDFTRTCFAGVNLSNSQFLNCNLERSIFDGADFVSARFIDCTASFSHFIEANLNSSYIHGSDFSNTNMTGVNANKTSVDSSNFNFANIRNSSWHESKIENSKFNQSDCYHAYFLKTHLYMTQMQYSVIENAMFNQCDIEKCDFQNSFAIKSEFMYSNISFSIFNHIKASRINMNHSSLGIYVTFSGGVLKYGYLNRLKATKVKFDDCDMEGANLSNTKLVKTNFDNSNLKFGFLWNSSMNECLASNTDISSASLDNAKITDVNFQNSILRDSHATNAQLIVSNFSSTDLRGANFDKAILTKSNLDSSCLENASFKYTNLQSVSLNAASFNAATDFINANMGMATGNLWKVKADGTKESVGIDTIILDTKLLHEAENYSKFLKFIGNVLCYAADSLYKSDWFIQYPFKSYRKFIAILSCIAFGVVAYEIAMIEINLNIYSKTGQLPSVILIVFLSGSIGFAIGHRATSILGISSIIIASIGFFKTSIIGGIMALFGTCAAGYTLKYFAYKSLDEYISYLLHKFCKGLKKISEIIGLTTQQKYIIKQKQKAINYHIPISNKVLSDKNINYKPEYDLLEVRKQNYYYAFSDGSIEAFDINDITEELQKLRPEYKYGK